MNEISDQSLLDAYTYLLSRFLVVRQEHMDRAADGFAYNTILYNPLGSADFVNPNLDVAYFEAWFAVDDDTAVLFEVPEITGRYYTAQLLDEWGEVIVNINDRVTPAQPYGPIRAGRSPARRLEFPDGAARIELHSTKAKLLGAGGAAGRSRTTPSISRKGSTLRSLGDLTAGRAAGHPGLRQREAVGR